MTLRLALVLLLAAVCSRAAESPLILISFDGFRWDYCERYPNETPTLRGLKREGVSARGLIPVFPSNTFPNHYSIVTGLYPVNHGIVNNDFSDATDGRVFKVPLSVGDSRWWGGEPIWTTAIKQGRVAATDFWVGSEAAVDGVRPNFWRKYDYSIPFERRLDDLIGWMKLPPAQRPAVIAFYLEETNGYGHRYGPDSPELASAIALGDRRVAEMLARLRAEGIEPNLVLVSDHGMTSTSPNRSIVLEDHLDLARVQVDSEGSVVGLRPHDGDVAALVRAFENVPHVKAYRVEDLPAHFHLKPSPRVAPVWLLPDEGWHVDSRARLAHYKRSYPKTGYPMGDHGYDPRLPNMHGLFIAHGPAFRRGVEIPAVENVHVYNLLCAVLKLKPAPNDGDDRLVKAALRGE